MEGGSNAMNVDRPVPHLRTSTSKSFSSSSSNFKLPMSSSTANSASSSSLSCCHSETERKIELIDEKEQKIATGPPYNHVFDTAPSQSEAEDAVASLQSLMQALSPPSASPQNSDSYDSRILQSDGYKRLYDAVQLLQNDLSFKRLVLSLSSDKAVWDAVMNNILRQKLPLQELPKSVHQVESRGHQVSYEPNLGILILTWILEIMKGKVVELIESFYSLMSDIFQSPKMEKCAMEAAGLDGKVRSSLLLCIVILLIVIVARTEKMR
ncbi:hypothetical protein L6164_003602 [Bauhinia variegata]|uniref:Uncharacterized protein n=3 Tax=Bauhinia variegata TaxID=167791 RepID=A0ACB9Q1C1_BAUVA|nr:hypothetical protein L6164_003599 [Bauhinia variegata]KAI4354757.1 hypothetical protein L6164_003600 [Bauhinia variegata]KAI4354760.1 hypothetical protein L6164_003602 [Bauhinia variegata]